MQTIDNRKNSDVLDEILESALLDPSEALDYVEETKYVDFCLRINQKNLFKNAEVDRLMGKKVGLRKKQHKRTKNTPLTPEIENIPASISYNPEMVKLEDGRFAFETTKSYAKTLDEYLSAVESNNPAVIDGFL